MEEINKWDYGVTKMFHERHYTGVIQEHHLKEEKTLKIKVGMDEEGKPVFEELDGWLVMLDKKKYILNQKYKIGDKEIPINKLLPIKIGKTEQFRHSTSIYHRPTKRGGIQIFKITPERTMTFRDWFNGFAQFKHTNEKHWTMYKAIVLGSFFLRYNYRIATCPGFGKDSLPTILADLMPLEVGIYTPRSAPKLMTMLEKRLLVIDEIADIRSEEKTMLEPVIRTAGDMRTSYHNSALEMEGMTKSEYDIKDLSIGFIYNELKDYQPPQLKRDKSHRYFDNSFTEATKDRFIPFLFEGNLDIRQFKRLNTKEVYVNNVKFLKDWVMMTKWLMQGGFYKALEHEKKSGFVWHKEKPINNETSRLNGHFHKILDVFRAISWNEKQFNEYADELYLCYQKYIMMVSPEDYESKFRETVFDNYEVKEEKFVE